MVKAKQFLIANAFAGQVKASDFRLEEKELPDLKDGEVLLQGVYLTVDPYMRLMPPPVDHVMIGEQVAKVLESKDPNVKVDSYVRANGGWSTHFIAKGSDVIPVEEYPSPDWPKSLALGILGMPGVTAYFGFLEICKPQPGETVVISGAAGAVGTTVGQIAKIKGCRVIGFAGSQEKIDYLKELGFDEAINYKTIDSLDAAIKKAAPNGVDCYYDNVGGEFASTVISNMNRKGRITSCGCISGYNATEKPKASVIQSDFIGKQLTMTGFMIFDPDNARRYPEAIKAMIPWIQEGKLRYREHVTKGFENTPKAFIELFTGANIGKAIVEF